MKNKFFISILIIIGCFSFNTCSPDIDIGDSLDGIFNFNLPYCYQVLNSTTEAPIYNAKTTAKYLNEKDEKLELILFTNSEGYSCHNWIDFYYVEISADGFETIIFKNGKIPSTVRLIPL